jgi:hypothetical protein
MVLSVLLVVGEVEVDPDPAVEQNKIELMLKQAKNQKREYRVIQKLLQVGYREIGKPKKGTGDFGVKLEELR